jgi:thiol-disulfide isomerase/thioredoxin/sugar lactone lactonase YvrE
MTRARAWLLGTALTIGCATSTAVALKKPTAPHDGNVGGAPMSSAVAVVGAPIVGRPYAKRTPLLPENEREVPPGLAKARGWLNVTRTPNENDLAGRVVVLDFWTSCCINCIHTIPTLSMLEKKYATDPFLVIGVHTQKFDAEPEVERLRAAMIRLGITHPVAIDGDRGIWEDWGITGWPTIVVLDAKGRVVFADSGEPDPEELDAIVESVLAEGAEQKLLAKTAATFLGKEVDAKSPLAFPEKIAKVPGGYAIADSGHDRIVFVDDAGKVTDVVGDGTRGKNDGAYAKAQFAHPQGMVAMGDVVYVADTENHEIRAIDRKNKRVSTIAGIGALGEGRLADEVDGRKTALRSPWDLAVVSGKLYVALAGSHQIALVDPLPSLDGSKVSLFAGSGREDRIDGPRLKAALAQPSGLATDGKDLFVLDSETSSIRKIELASGNVTTLVGKALFVFGDKDGDGSTARLQHPIGLAYGDGALWVADTYNSKIKRVDPKTGETKTVASPGSKHDALFEPAGLAVMPTTAAGTVLLVADTNHGRIAKIAVGNGPAAPAAWPLVGLAAPK